MLHCIEGQPLALMRCQAADVKQVVVVRNAGIPIRFAEGWVKDLGVNPVEYFEPSGDDPGVRIKLASLRKRYAIRLADRVAVAQPLGSRGQISVFGVPQIVGCAVVVDEPDHLGRVADEIARRPDGDEAIPVGAEIREAEGQHLLQELIRARAERKLQKLDRMTAGPQVPDQPLGQKLSAAPLERHDGGADEHSHGCRMRSCLSRLPEADRSKGVGHAPDVALSEQRVCGKTESAACDFFSHRQPPDGRGIRRQEMHRPEHGAGFDASLFECGRHFVAL